MRRIIPYRSDLKDKARQLRNNSTKAEIILWTHLRQGAMLGHDFDRQRPMLNFIVDFFCKDLQLAIEVDGSVHDQPLVKSYDGYRQERIEAVGVTVLRFSNEAVLHHTQSVLGAVQEWIEANGGARERTPRRERRPKGRSGRAG